MYPGESGIVTITKKRKTYLEAVPESIVVASEHRGEPREAHYLSCSPWQTIPYSYQIELKTRMLSASFIEYAGTEVTIDGFREADITEGYRTKMEYSFWFDTEQERLFPAFHKRGSPFVNEILPDGCMLGSGQVNRIALDIARRLQEQGVEKRILKTLTIRESKTTGAVLALLLYTDPDADIPLRREDIPGLAGLIVATSPRLSPASIVETIRYADGDDSLEESIRGFRIRYPYDGFFQNNIPQFERALDDMERYVEKGDRLVELYSGVGTIGIALHAKADTVVGVEVGSSAVWYAAENARANGIGNYGAMAMPAESIEASTLSGARTVILDPPRSGLHPNVIRLLREASPERIIYLSCNPATQARDFAALKDVYTPTGLYGYDFYPHTLHMESLLVLDRK
jgi:23S rRNA (uracil1939-C5)-methyltransferase